ncbi:uncharacterized abhydrolase domain-containing protein DDB_G0269086-like [Helianthus annuus]|uniref:uncharacterized abhydrolase domain-containing protein DDB_G0269086-like n=1 Tax=Helianthus annuus TaxID=4232 RepID=UPI001652DE42|nr:uncharacterized abhydrolase domain-containing protein DDB_G0269086-like [Helianthus annuus]
MTLQNVNVGIPAEDIALPTAKTVDWFPRLRPIELKKLDNNELWVLRMMLTRPDRRARPVVREKSGEDAALWRMFDPDFKGKVELLPCAEGEGFNLDIVGNFRVPTRDVLNAPLPQGKGNLGALGMFEAKTVPKKHAEKKHAEKLVRGFQKKKPEATAVPSLVSHAAGGGAAAGGTSVGSKPADERKRKPEKAVDAGEKKRSRIQTKRTTVVSQTKPVVAAEPQQRDFSSLFDAPLSPPHDTAMDAGVNKEFTCPFVKVVSEPPARAEDIVKKTAAQIFDTVDSSDNLISPEDTGDLNLKFADGEKQQSDAEKHKTPTTEKASGSASGGARALPRELRINQLSSMLVGSSIVANAIMEDYKVLGRREEETARLRAEAEELVKAAREGAEQLERDKAAFDWKETLSNERKSWKESWAKQNETLFRVRQELTNVKAANAALGKEKVAAEAVAGKAKEAEARTTKALEEAKEAGARVAKALEEANADRTHLNQTVAGLQIVKAILDAPENVTGVDQIRLRAQDAGFKAGLLAAALAAYENMSISSLEKLDECLDAEDYVDHLRMLYADAEESEKEETAGDDKGGAGTTGTKKD